MKFKQAEIVIPWVKNNKTYITSETSDLKIQNFQN